MNTGRKSTETDVMGNQIPPKSKSREENDTRKNTNEQMEWLTLFGFAMSIICVMAGGGKKGLKAANSVEEGGCNRTLQPWNVEVIRCEDAVEIHTIWGGGSSGADLDKMWSRQ